MRRNRRYGSPNSTEDARVFAPGAARPGDAAGAAAGPQLVAWSVLPSVAQAALRFVPRPPCGSPYTDINAIPTSARTIPVNRTEPIFS